MPSSLDDLIAGARSAKRAHRDVDVTLDQAIAEQLEAIDARILATEQQQIDVSTQADLELAEATRDARMSSPRTGEIEAARDAKIGELTEQLEQLEQERAALADGTLITIRFTQLPGQVWAEIGARNPARPDVLIDQIYHYNYHDAAKQAAAYRDPEDAGGRAYAELVVPAEGDAEPTLEPISPEQWVGIFEVISGHEFERIASAIWDLNDYGPQQRIAAAGKASRVGSAKR
jgi:hypothetical protein